MRKNVHFIGIGGIGVSSLAQYYLATGWKVGGSDAEKSEITDDLKKRGVRILINPKNINLKNIDLVIHSAAIKPDHPELLEAKKLGIKTQLYSEAVGELTKKYFTVAVAGSHGKSTTTALIGLIMVEAGLDPTIIIGTKLRELEGPPFQEGRSFSGGNNFRLGQSKYLVLEADEYARSFHNYFPKIAVLTNIDKEHLDIYKNLNGVLVGFKKYLKNVDSSGWIVANGEDKNINKVLKSYKLKARSYPIIWYGKGNHKLSIPGIHNQFNAEAAWQAVKLLGVKKTVVDKVFISYQGAWRRLEKLKIKNEKVKSIIYSDYAHHPTEIKATLQALKEKYPKKKLICVFQPHQQDRLNRLFKDFITAFDVADKTILYPLYKVKGRDTIGKTSEELSKTIRKPEVFYASDFKKILKLLSNNLASNSVIVFMSAGSLDGKVRKHFLQNFIS
ncbi:MAG: Mur ligase domain-containing protein [bacterium]|nr:Mur ligase domain-containing protein [bacterium]